MIPINHDGLILCQIQGRVFEASIERFECSSEIFIRRFVHSEVSELFDNKAILEFPYTEFDVLNDLEQEYGQLTYGSAKYTKNEMFWIGYTYRYFCVTYNRPLKWIYRHVPPKEMRSVYLPYHTLGCDQAIERIFEAKNISFDEDAMLRRGIEIYRQIMIKKGRLPIKNQ